MPEWLYEAGIGENRAILVDNDTILEAAIELPGEIRVGAIVAGHFQDVVQPWGHAWVSSRGGSVLVREIPKAVTKGQLVRVEILREEILEPGRPKSLVGRITDRPAHDGPTLAERIGEHRAVGAVGPDEFERAGWSNLLEEALTGEIPFTGGELQVSLTPAMTLIDVDGWLAPADLAVAGARAAGLAIRRHGITGSIGIDLPTAGSRTVRQRAAEALDAAVPQPFERTAVNGFGFLQVVRRRERESLPEMLCNSPIPAAARALLRRAERTMGLGARAITGSPEVIALLEHRQDWLDELRRRIGADVRLQAKPGLTTWAFHVQAVQS